MEGHQMSTDTQISTALTEATSSTSTAKAPVKKWAVLGAACLTFQAYIFVAWLTSGQATRIPNGPTPVPTWHTVVMYSFWCVSVLLYLFCVYWVIVRPWRRDHRFNTDALIGLALVISLWFHDPMCNFFNNWVTFTTVLPNWGNWAAQIPGIQAHNAHLMAIPVVVTPSVYLYWALPVMCASCWLMRKVKARWPRINALGLLAICWSVNFTFDLLAEIGWVRLGYYVYPGATKAFTLFHGKYYQLPVYFPAAAAMILTGWAWLRYRRDDRGLTFVERGSAQMTRLSPPKRTFVRWLAIVGYLNLIIFVVFDVPMGWLGRYAEPWPNDIRTRSYLTDNMCRPDFDLCPSLLTPKD
jgi:hypothetical protein